MTQFDPVTQSASVRALSTVASATIVVRKGCHGNAIANRTLEAEHEALGGRPVRQE